MIKPDRFGLEEAIKGIEDQNHRFFAAFDGQRACGEAFLENSVE
jgi:hypothetical protein